ncbi:MAG: hypothetical protein CML99_01815 [Rhodobiaceae bacterium]|nr:hypothetical protein [Rhodobiaceae bacterium]
MDFLITPHQRAFVNDQRATRKFGNDENSDIENSDNKSGNSSLVTRKFLEITWRQINHQMLKVWSLTSCKFESHANADPEFQAHTPEGIRQALTVI